MSLTFSITGIRSLLHLCYRLDLTMITLSSYMRRSERRSLQDTTSLTSQLCPTVLKLLLDIYFHRLWSWRVALIHEYVELFHGVNVPLCSDWTFATRIVVIRAIVVTSENSVTSYSMQSRAGRTWCIRSKNSTDISAIRVLQIWVVSSIYWNTCVQSWICWLSIKSLATGSSYVTALSQSRLGVTRHWKQRIMASSSGCGTIISSYARSMSRPDSDGLLHRCSNSRRS